MDIEFGSYIGNNLRAYIVVGTIGVVIFLRWLSNRGLFQELEDDD